MIKFTNEELSNVEEKTTEANEFTFLLKNFKYNKTQIKVLLFFPLLNFLVGACVTLLPPLLPIESAKKGVTPATYVFFISIYHLVIVLISPVFGKYIHKTGANFMINFGNFTTAAAVILFGLLTYVPGPIPFSIMALVLRFAQGIGNAAFTTALYSVAVMEFSDNMAGIMSAMQISFVIGRIVGPLIAGVLFQVDGFVLPFEVLGGILFILSIMTYLLLPRIESAVQTTKGIFRLLLIPSIAIATYQIVATTICLGFVGSLLEPHLGQFNLKPSLLGLVFATDGFFAAIGNVFWGYIAKKKVSLKVLSGCGSLVLTFAFLIIGPAPFFPIKSSLWMVILALALMGFNASGELLIPYIDNMQKIINIGYPKSIVTFAISTSLWSSSRNTGLFIGSSVSGLMFDTIGFRDSTLLLVVLQLLGAGFNFGYYFSENQKRLREQKRIVE